MLTALKTLAGVAILKNSCETGGEIIGSINCVQATPGYACVVSLSQRPSRP